MAQRLVEGGVQTKKQGRRQGPADDDEVVAHAVAHAVGHIGPVQQWVGEQQQRHAQHTGGAGQVQRLAKRCTNGRQLAAPMLFGPDRQQGLQHAHQGDKDADKHCGSDRQRRQRIGRKLTGHDGVGHAKGHDGQLPRQHGASVAGDDRKFRHSAQKASGALAQQQPVVVALGGAHDGGVREPVLGVFLGDIRPGLWGGEQPGTAGERCVLR